jgi:hypothetical protein
MIIRLLLLAMESDSIQSLLPFTLLFTCKTRYRVSGAASGPKPYLFAFSTIKYVAFWVEREIFQSMSICGLEVTLQLSKQKPPNVMSGQAKHELRIEGYRNSMMVEQVWESFESDLA